MKDSIKRTKSILKKNSSFSSKSVSFSEYIQVKIYKEKLPLIETKDSACMVGNQKKNGREKPIEYLTNLFRKIKNFVGLYF